ncbi:MAG: glycosyltransferase family 2 protein [Anaerolineaceae bacterium]|nr:glycosyltransferase family 2 protein [Anaerolineaceae bacterium]
MSDTVKKLGTELNPARSSPEISVVIPCYNVPEEQFRSALDSVLRQTFQSFEVIVVDDGSTPSNADVLQRLCGNREKITLIRTENRGVSAARNTGVQHAHSRYTAFLDADDLLADDYLERARQAAEETGADFVIGGITIIRKQEDFTGTPRRDPLQYELFDPETSSRLLHYLIGPRVTLRFPGGQIGRGPWARLVRTDLLKEILFDEELRIGEDVIWNVQVLRHSKTVCLVRESWYGYWKNPNSVMHRYDPDFINASEKTLLRLSSLLDKSDDSLYADFSYAVYSFLHDVFWIYSLRQQRTEDRDTYRKTVKRLYREAPWRELGSLRFFKTFNGKKKLVSLFFRLHLYFDMLALKERITAKKRSRLANCPSTGGNRRA